jgi:hypothetical protein
MFLNQEKAIKMSEDIKGNSPLPEVAICQSFEDLRALADQTLDCKEKMILDKICG